MEDILLQYALVNNAEELALLDDKEDTTICLYLCRAQLLPDPHHNTPWRLLYESQNDRTFITIMGIDALIFEFILTSGFASQRYKKPVTCPDINLHGIPCLNRHSLNTARALGLILHYLNSTMQETSLQQIFVLVPTTNDEIENTTYNGWLSEHFISSVIKFSAEGIIMSTTRTNTPGSWHDSRLASHIYTQLQLHMPSNYYIVMNTTFLRGTSSINERIRAPLKHGQVLCMRAIQGAFGRLHLPLNIANEEALSNLIEICLRLHNLHAIHVGINQIWTVYTKLWQATEDDMDVW
ncbi:hypothetical protein CY34DRAFT_26917 [Suillus luteus UH-Slu-Lm8-n1]|uniref:DDE Tnp4 domain-containing protein n=1 Tax=Suillus luteus UH-Slu-Lm8-n1 TaxID=930992 RepID=A0A0D0A7Q4_9AGAM|nr:hypothetical protein CY34DRAFT_26917 [Suillus luteus UH-Slu-Lm8-n1]